MENNTETISGYSIYSKEQMEREKKNDSEVLFQPFPDKKYQVIYADPPWDYGGKTQYDKSCIKSINTGFKKHIFMSSASFEYPTLKLSDLKKLDVKSISADDCVLFMWTTGPQFENAISLGNAWGFKYKTVAFVWDKQVHNPGRYTLSQTEFVLAFRRGKFPTPRGARNIRQMVSVKRSTHSEKPSEVSTRIEQMFPFQGKIELFARSARNGWDNWGLEAPSNSEQVSESDELGFLRT